MIKTTSEVQMSNRDSEDLDLGRAIANGASGAVAGFHIGMAATAATGGAGIVAVPLFVLSGYFFGVARSMTSRESPSALSAAGDVASVYDSFYNR
jgi:hypothetical protein